SFFMNVGIVSQQAHTVSSLTIYKFLRRVVCFLEVARLRYGRPSAREICFCQKMQRASFPYTSLRRRTIGQFIRGLFEVFNNSSPTIGKRLALRNVGRSRVELKRT